MIQDSMKKNIVDTKVIVVGGGLVGCVFAEALSSAGIDNVVIDTQNLRNNNKLPSDGRASALALASKRVFENIGLWSRLEKFATPILDIRVSDHDSFQYLHFNHQEVGDDPLGFMLENSYIRNAQAWFLEENNHTTFFAPNKVKELVRSDKDTTAHLTDGTVIRAPLIVAADGRNSQMRKMFGIHLTKHSYNQSAIVCTIEHQRSHNFIAHERFLPHGPFAILPLLGSAKKPNKRSSIVWTERPDLVSVFVALPKEEFLFELQRRAGDFLGNLKLVSPRWDYPLTMQFTNTCIGYRFALIGDSAHGMHPIAGQGLNMGIRDAATLAEIVVDGLRSGNDIGSWENLKNYQTRRRFDNFLMLAATDGINRLFSNNFLPIKVVRDFGLATVNKFPGIKKAFIRYAMGEMPSAPRLMRGVRL